MNTPLCSSICTDFVSETSRFEHWADKVSTALNRFELDSGERDNFDARISTFQLGGVAGLFSQGSSPFAGCRTRQPVTPARPHSYHIMMGRRGSGVIRQGRQEMAYGAGDLVLFNTAQDIVLEMQDANFASLTISEEVIRTWIPDPEGHQVRVLRGDRGWAAVLSSYLSNLKPEIIAATASAQRLLMSTHSLWKRRVFHRRRMPSFPLTTIPICPCTCLTGSRSTTWIRKFRPRISRSISAFQ